ncbi:MAG: L-serine ammonia-lyase, iron-sulfur-dependent, subunit alpha, partial [Patescibacteria group bacterium]
ICVIIAENATLSAAAAGCQAEVGAANSCAAAAAVEMKKGTPQQAMHAAAMAMKSSLGLVCDPLGGLVEVPCIKRNALGSQHALGAADLALAGVESFIPFDEVVETMYEIGKIMSPRLRETALGGLATTKTGMMIKKKMGLPVIQ